MRRFSLLLGSLLIISSLSGCRSLLSLVYTDIYMPPYEEESEETPATVPLESTPAEGKADEPVGVARLYDWRAVSRSPELWSYRYGGLTSATIPDGTLIPID